MHFPSPWLSITRPQFSTVLNWNHEAEREENLRPRSSPSCCHRKTYEETAEWLQVELSELFMPEGFNVISNNWKACVHNADRNITDNKLQSCAKVLGTQINNFCYIYLFYYVCITESIQENGNEDTLHMKVPHQATLDPMLLRRQCPWLWLNFITYHDGLLQPANHIADMYNSLKFHSTLLLLVPIKNTHNAYASIPFVDRSSETALH